MLKGAVFGWILRSEDRIPGFFPISPKWRFILFGLGTIQFARHPEGLVENGQAQGATPHRAADGPVAARTAPGAAGTVEPEPTPVEEAVS